MENEDKELANITVDEPVRFEPQNEPANTTEAAPAGPYERVGLEPIEPVEKPKKSTVGPKILFIFSMLLSAAIGAYAVWVFLF